MRPLKNGRAPRVRHYLLSLALAPDVRMHGYLMADDRRYAIEAAERMVAEADKVSTYPLRHMILATRLTADAERVRAIISERSPEVAALLKEATDYHFSAWFMLADDPYDDVLMQMH